jgi:hypothetical protein
MKQRGYGGFARRRPAGNHDGPLRRVNSGSMQRRTAAQQPLRRSRRPTLETFGLRQGHTRRRYDGKSMSACFIPGDTGQIDDMPATFGK